MYSTHRIVTIAVLIVTGGCAATGQRGALDLAYRAMQKGRYDLALMRLSRAEHYRPPPRLMAAEISFLRAQCYERSGRISESVGAYSYTIENFLSTTYARQAQERLAAINRTGEPTAAPNATAPHP